MDEQDQGMEGEGEEPLESSRMALVMIETPNSKHNSSLKMILEARWSTSRSSDAQRYLSSFRSSFPPPYHFPLGVRQLRE